MASRLVVLTGKTSIFNFFFPYKRCQLFTAKATISFTITKNTLQILLMQRDVYQSQEDFKEDEYEITQLATQIRNDLQFLVQPHNLTKNIYEFNNMLQLEKLILQLPQSLQSKYKSNYQELAYLYTQYLVEFSDLFQFWNKQQASVTKENTNQVFEQLMFIAKKELFDYQKELQMLQFKRILQKVHNKNPQQHYKNRDYIERGLNSFIDVTKENLVCDKCVGCNSFFYKFHLIEGQINKKDVPVKFLYHFDNKSGQLQKLTKQHALINPPLRKTIDFNQIQKHQQLLSKLLVSILNNSGGLIMIGCQQLKYLVNNHQLSFIKNQDPVNEFYFVIGLDINAQKKQRFISKIGAMIKNISPTVTLKQNIRIRFLPVLPSRFNKGYCISNAFPQNQNQNTFVVLIEVNPNAPSYRLTKPMQQSKPFNLLRYENDPQDDLLYQMYECPNANTNAHSSYKQSKPISFENEQDEQQNTFMNVPNKSIYKKHTCYYDQ